MKFSGMPESAHENIRSPFKIKKPLFSMSPEKKLTMQKSASKVMPTSPVAEKMPFTNEFVMLAVKQKAETKRTSRIGRNDNVYQSVRVSRGAMDQLLNNGIMQRGLNNYHNKRVSGLSKHNTV